MASTEAGKDSSTYSLKWTNHKNIILQTFAEQLHKEWLVDVTVSCEGQFIKAHKMMLSACSPFFKEIFSTHARVDHPVIIMNGIKYAIFQQVIDFMYEGEIKCEHEDLELLIATAESLQIKGLCKIRPEDALCSPCKIEEDKKDVNKTDLVANKTDSVANKTDLVANIDVDTTQTNQTKSRKRRKQFHSPILNQSVEGTPADESLFSGLFGNEDDIDNQKSDAKMSKQDTQIDKNDIKQVPKIPRPPNAFMIFANEWRKKLANQYSGESNKEISVRLGNMWKSLSVNTRDQYYAAAKKADEEHKIKYPGYYYSPKEARLRKEMRGNNAAKSSNAVLVNSSGVVKDIEPSSVVTLVPMPEAVDEDSSEMIPSDEIKEEPGTTTDDTSENSDSSGTNGGVNGEKSNSTNKQLPPSVDGTKQ